VIRALIPLLDEKKDAEEIASWNARDAQLESLPRAISPIIVPLDGGATIDDLLAAEASVRFDVDGRCRPGTWSWVKPRAGWLVWLPRDGSREVSSGLHLFGNVTWWLFWKDGYAALSALDDDGDGVLRGEELERLGVWQDRNGDGHVDSGEVRTLAELGIVEISCLSQASDRPDVLRWSPRGVTFEGGETRPTWDVLLHYEAPVATARR
jgi:hypothetical protein